jgi:hypothetical protein
MNFQNIRPVTAMSLLRNSLVQISRRKMNGIGERRRMSRAEGMFRGKDCISYRMTQLYLTSNLKILTTSPGFTQLCEIRYPRLRGSISFPTTLVRGNVRLTIMMREAMRPGRESIQTLRSTTALRETRAVTLAGIAVIIIESETLPLRGGSFVSF